MDCLVDPSTLTLKIPKFTEEIKEVLKNEKLEFTIDENNNEIILSGNNYIDFIGKFNISGEILKYIPCCMVINVKKDSEEAILPSKSRMTDVGVDLTIYKKHKDIRKNVIMYDTGIKVELPVGFYAEVVPRSSLVKTGWMLANSVGIIDNTYTGNIYIVVAKIDPDAEELPLPFKGFQLIVRKQYYPLLNLTDNIQKTSRGDGGFGSTSTDEASGSGSSD